MKEAAAMKEPAASVKKDTLQASCGRGSRPTSASPPTNLHVLLTYFG